MSKIILENDILYLEVKRTNERYKELKASLEKYHTYRYNLESELLKTCMKMSEIRKEIEIIENKVKKRGF